MFTETEFLREAAWVILCSGFRERTVRSVFSYISLSFYDWSCAQDIVRDAAMCMSIARRRFANIQKLTAICTVAKRVEARGFTAYKESVLQDPRSLQELPFIGPVTWAHLAKNLGFDVAKEDRHLVGLARRLGFSSGASLCAYVAGEVGERVSVVDLVFWRYLAQRPDRNPKAAAPEAWGEQDKLAG